MATDSVLLDPQEALARGTLDCYLAAIMAVSDFLEAVGPGAAAAHREPLIRMRKRLAFQPTPDTLKESRDTLRVQLLSFAAKLEERRQMQSQDLDRLRTLLGQAAGGIAIRKDGYADQLRQFSRLMRKLEAENPGMAWERLRAQAERLREFVEAVCLENQAALGKLESEVAEFRGRLGAPAEWEAGASWGGRDEIERQARARLGAPRTFCLLLFLVEPGLEEVTRQVGAALACHVRARDFVGRWADAEFVVLLECGYAAAVSRAAEISHWLSGGYRVESGGKESSVAVRLRAGTVLGAGEEGSESLVEKARKSIGEEIHVAD